MSKSLKVLNVEDHAPDSVLLCRQLEEAGYKVTLERVETAEAMASALDTHEWDLVISDFNLPQFSSTAALKMVKERGLDIPFIILSGAIGEESVVAAMRAGANDYLLKDKTARLVPVIERELQEATNRRKRKRAEQALNKQRKFVEAVLENITDAIIACDARGVPIYFNRAARALHGLDVEPIASQQRAEKTSIYKADDQIMMQIEELPLIRAALQGERISNEEIVIKSQNGNDRTVLISGQGLSDVDGKKLGAVIAVHDITERKRAEREREELLAREHSALIVSEQAKAQISRILESITDGFMAFDQTWHFTYINPTGAQTLGRNANELLGKNLWEEFPEMASTSFGHLYQQATTEGVPLELEDYYEPLHAWLNVRAYPTETGLSIYFLNVTERKQLEEQFRQSQKMEAVGRLAGGIAHDFNNLLTAILGYTELSLMRVGDDNPLNRNLSEINKAATRAAALTRQLLAFSRKQMLKPSVFNLNIVVEEINSMLRRLIGEDIELITRLEPDLPQVLIDPGQIEQVIVNLVVNARDAMPNGGTLTIETADVYLDEEQARKQISAGPGPYVKLAVNDTGFGMDEKTLLRIFEPFFTTKEMGKGTGLGLSTVYGIVKQSNGYISVTSEPGRGTTFRIYLPQIVNTTREDTTQLEDEILPPGSETVLLIENEALMRAMAREILEGCGYKVLTATYGNEALKICQSYEKEIHLILTDLVMPGMSGREISEQIKLLRPEIKVVYMSRLTDDANLKPDLYDSENAIFLKKPFSPNTLAQKVRAALDTIDLQTK